MFDHIVKTIRFHPRKIVSIDLSSEQTTGMGAILQNLYMKTNILEAFSEINDGCPYNGGRHTLRLQGPFKDVVCAMQLIRDETPVRFHPCIVDAKTDLTRLCSFITDHYLAKV